MQVYRFRSMKYLLEDKYQELKKQEIYFASPEQLNDPMEGLQDIFWRGDRIVWKKFFKHYVFCLHVTHLHFLAAGPSIPLNASNIPILGRWDELPSPALRVFDEVWHRFLNLPKIPEFIEALANTNRKIRYEELWKHLGIIHHVMLYEMEEVCFAKGFISERRCPPEGLPPVGKILESAVKAMAQLEEDQDEEKTNAILDFDKGYRRGIGIRLLENGMPTGILGGNIQLVQFDFSGAYLKEFEKMVLPNWYTACFMKDYRNSSVWAHYGDKHRGACLIFESVKAGGCNSLNLSRGTGEDAKPRPFSEINYEGKSGEIDFFRSISTLPDYIRDLLLTDGQGNASESFPSDIDDWRQKYFYRFFHDTNIKTKDWAYEKECRLTLQDIDGHLDEKDTRKLSYAFNSLKGIIFGIRASDEDISRVVKIIQKKCEKDERTDFKFYQADYSPTTGDIRKYEILFLQNI